MPNTTLRNTSKKCIADWSHQLIWGKREGRIGNKVQTLQVLATHQINLAKTFDTLKKTMINEGIPIVIIAEVNSNWSKITIKEDIYNRKNGWLKKRRISTGYN